MFEKLLQYYKLDVNATSSKGFTALHFAARDDHLKMATQLMVKNVDKTIKNKSGKLF